MKTMGQIHYIKLGKIRKNSDNPNPHSEEKTRTLANNIEEFGLLNPINVKSLNKGEYEIIAGEGRFEAFRLLERQEIPCIVNEDTSDYLDWGRRLSENKVRSFNWIAECIELANMKAEGKSWKELAGLFGYQQTKLHQMIATGECWKRMDSNIVNLIILNFDLEDYSKSEKAFGLNKFMNYILPLRIPPEKRSLRDPGKGKKGWQKVDYSLYDYCEVKACIEKLVSGKLKLEELPVYSADQRLEIERMDQSKKLEILLEDARKVLDKNHEQEIVDIQKDSKELFAKVKDEYQEQLNELEEKKEILENQLAAEEDSDKVKELKKQIFILEGKEETDKTKYEGKLELQKKDYEKQLKDEETKKKKEWKDKEKEIKEKAKADKQTKYEEELKEREAKVKKDVAELKQMVEEIKSGKMSIDRWLKDTVNTGNKLVNYMEAARTYGLYIVIEEKLEYQQRLFSTVKGLLQELQGLKGAMVSKKLEFTIEDIIDVGGQKDEKKAS